MILMKPKQFAWAVALVLLAGCGGPEKSISPPAGPAAAAQPVMIGFSQGGVRLERWKKDEQSIVDRARELGANVISLTALENPDLQNNQAENLVIQGVDVLVVVPQDSEKSSRIVELAHKAGIPVIAYDRIIRNCALDYYVSFDNVKVGEYQAAGVIAALDPNRANRLAYIGGSPVDANSAQLKQGAMRVLQPLLDSGKATLELETFTADWSAQNAYQDMKHFLDEGGRVDGVVAANDATAGGVIRALHEFGLSAIPVSGQDAELGACQRVAQGTQTVTVYKPIAQLGRMAAEMAVQAARGLPVPVNASVNNGFRDIPSVLLESISVNRENLKDTVVRDGFHSYEEVFGTHP